MLFSTSIVVLLVFLAVAIKRTRVRQKKRSKTTIPLSVNYHFTRRCNYQCNYCFHTDKNGFNLPLEKAAEGMKLLKEAGTQKINFSGGEPFYIRNGRHIGDLCKVAKKLGLAVSIISNGSLIKENWFQQYAKFVDILAVSCDSFNDDTNKQIGRFSRSQRETHVEAVRRVAALCAQYGVRFKLNSVITGENWEEDFAPSILELKPMRWKVFQCLELDGENSGDSALRDCKPYLIKDEQFQAFLDRHKHLECLVPESNDNMRSSYLILDERMQFLDSSKGGKTPSKSILDVGVAAALDSSGFDEEAFFRRGGRYDWTLSGPAASLDF